MFRDDLDEPASGFEEILASVKQIEDAANQELNQDGFVRRK